MSVLPFRGDVSTFLDDRSWTNEIAHLPRSSSFLPLLLRCFSVSKNRPRVYDDVNGGVSVVTVLAHSEVPSVDAPPCHKVSDCLGNAVN